MISHRRPQVTVIERTATGWSETNARAGEVLSVEPLQLSISIDELYAGIELGA